MKGMKFRMQVDVFLLLGCGNCADICSGIRVQALSMVPLEGQLAEADNWNYCVANVSSKQNLVDIKSKRWYPQLRHPSVPIQALAPVVARDSVREVDHPVVRYCCMVANATGCSTHSGSVPSTPYTTNEKGQGPARANSLFEDFCEFGLGMELAEREDA